MAFGKLSEWFPNAQHIDPRHSEKYTIGSKYAVVSVTRYPTYKALRTATLSVSETRMLGLIQAFQAPQTRPIQRLFELGSRYPYSVAGKFMGNFTLTSIMFDAGGNLLGGIYEEAFMEKKSGDNLSKSGDEILNRPKLYDEGLAIPNGGYTMRDVGGETQDVKKDWGAIRMSIDDNRLDVPFGLVLTLFQSSQRIRTMDQDLSGSGSPNDKTFRAVACLFFEMCKLEDYSFDLNANQELITEYARFFYTGLVNVKVALQSQPGEGSGSGNFSQL